MLEIDEDVLKRSQAGDPAAFDRLVDQCYPLVYNTAYRMLADEEEACDATQEAFVRAFGAIRRFRSEASFTTWLYRIATNVCLDQLRRRKRRPSSLRLVNEEQSEEPGVRDIPDDSPDPAGWAEQAERQQLVELGLQRLSEEHRTVIVLYDINGLSYEEIAGVLELPLGTVKSRLNRARMALKDEIEPHLELFGVQ
ncbi:MAG: RNA polymerase sigma factor [Armatimonadota bacterium]